MRGWSDDYAGNAFREGGGGGKRSKRPGKSINSSFDQEMKDGEDAYNRNLAIVTIVPTVAFLAYLWIKVIPYL